MKLIIGGKYQGKLDFAKAAYGLADGDVFTCTDTEIDFGKPCIYGIEDFTLALVQAGREAEAVDYFRERKVQWTDSVLICRDIFCGVVPLEAELRLWQRVTGQLCQYLTAQGERVSRIYCGLEQRLK